MSTGPQFRNGSSNLWSPEFDELLKASAGAPSKLERAIQEIRKRNPDLATTQILRRTAELNITNWHNPWTDKEKIQVLECARELSAADLAKRLRRTRPAIYLLLWKSKTPARCVDGFTQNELARDLHISPRKVRRWVSLGWLTTYQGRIKDRSLQRFLEEHSDEIDTRKLDGDVRLWLQGLGLREVSKQRPADWFGERKQSFQLHVCGRCGRKIFGNAFHRHLKVCATQPVGATQPPRPDVPAS